MRDRAVAEELAGEVRRANGRTWRKVTTLLGRFGVYRLTPAVRERIDRALSDAALVVVPPIREAKRYQTVRLSLNGAATGSDMAQSIGELGNGIRHVTAWRPGEAPERLRADSIATRDAVLWIEVDLEHADPAALHHDLVALCGPELTAEMLDDLLEADPYPKSKPLTKEAGVRAISTVRVTARERTNEESETVAGLLDFQLIEFLASPRWIVSCWHRRVTYAGSDEVADESPDTPRHLQQRLAERWIDENGQTAGDLGTLALHHIACGYTDVRRHFHSWLESWELEFLAALNDHRPSRCKA